MGTSWPSPTKHFEKACFLFKHKFHKLHAYLTATLILQVILMKNTREAVAVTITFCPFIEIRNCRDQLNIKALRHGIL